MDLLQLNYLLHATVRDTYIIKVSQGNVRPLHNLSWTRTKVLANVRRPK